LTIASGAPEILNIPWELLRPPEGEFLGLDPLFAIPRLLGSEKKLESFSGELRPCQARYFHSSMLFSLNILITVVMMLKHYSTQVPNANCFIFESKSNHCMSSALPLLLALLIAMSSACAQEVAYAYGEAGGRPLESGNITEYNSTDIITSNIAGAGPSLGGSGMTMEEMKREIALKLNVGNTKVRDEGLRLIRKYGGDGTIDQICSIYEHMVGNWSYARDTRGKEILQYSNQSLDYGEGENSGQGDCDDFSILLASLIESIGGTSRIILAYGPDGGHAYTEVYLGKAGGPESDVGRMLAWLRKTIRSRKSIPVRT